MGTQLKFTVNAKDNGAKRTFDKVGDAADDMASKFGKVAKPALSMTASIAAAGSRVAPATVALIGFGKAAASVAVQLAPAAAALPAFAAGAVFVQKTIALAGPAMGKALTPVTDAWKSMEGPVGRLATKGLPDLSKQFVKVNFPAIRTATQEIAKQTNSVVLAVGKWTTSANGQAAIRDILKGTTQFTGQLARLLPGVADSFLDMVGRASGPGFKALGESGGALERLANGAKKLFDSVSSDDVTRAYDKLAGFAGAVVGFGQAVGQLGRWVSENQAKVKAYSDVLAGVAVVAGVASGNWAAAVIGALTLVQNHWRDLQSAMETSTDYLMKQVPPATHAANSAMTDLQGGLAAVAGWWRRISAEGTNVGAILHTFGQAAQDTGSWLKGLGSQLAQVGAALMPQLRAAAETVTSALRDNRDAVAKARNILDALGVVIAKGVIPAGVAFTRTVLAPIAAAIKVLIPIVGFLSGMLINQFAASFSAAAYVINYVVLPAIRIFSRIMLDQLSAILHGAAIAFGWIPGIGPKLQRAAAQFDNFKREVNDALSGIRDRQVSVTAHFRAVGDVGVVTGNGTSSGRIKVTARAGGGPVERGRPYLVGEHGPELVVPRTSGKVLDANRTARLASSPTVTPLRVPTGGGDVYVTVNVHGSTLASEQQIENAVVKAIDSAQYRGRLRLRAS